MTLITFAARLGVSKRQAQRHIPADCPRAPIHTGRDGRPVCDYDDATLEPIIQARAAKLDALRARMTAEPLEQT